MARKLFEFDNPGYLDTLNMEEECASEKTFVRTPVPSPRSQNKRSRSLNETDSAYQDLVNYKLMYQPLKKQHKNQAQRELPSVPSTPKTRRRSEPVVMITHSKGKFGCYESGHDSVILDSPSAKSKTKYLEPIDSTKSFRDRINSSLAEENSEVFADVESEQSTRKESVAKKDQCPHYYILEPPIKEESAETQAKSSSKRNSKETKKYKKTSKKLKKRGGDVDACGLRVENNNRRKTDKSSVETSTPDTADNPYYHVLEVLNQSEEPHNQPTRSFSHRLLERFSAKVRTDTRKTYDLSNTKPSHTNTRTNKSCCSLLNFLVGCILLFSVVTCVTTILVIRGQIQSLCICSQPKGSGSSQVAKIAAVYDHDNQFTMRELNNSIIEEKEKSRALAAEVRTLTQMLQQIYNATRGPPGPPGTHGPPGPQGQQGPQGKPGHPGVRGLRGFNGSKGGRGEQGPAGYNGSRGYPGVKGPPGANGSQGERGPQGLKGAVVDFSNCSWKFKAGSNGVRHADVVLIEPKGKRIVGAICSTSSPSIPASYSFKLLDATAGSGNGYKCGCLTNGNLALACVIHYCECPSVT